MSQSKIHPGLCRQTRAAAAYLAYLAAAGCLTASLLPPHRCKLFYKKDNEFKEKGVGTLHLKPTATQKTQLLVRADTNLGGHLASRVACWPQEGVLRVKGCAAGRK